MIVCSRNRLSERKTIGDLPWKSIVGRGGPVVCLWRGWCVKWFAATLVDWPVDQCTCLRQCVGQVRGTPRGRSARCGEKGERRVTVSAVHDSCNPESAYWPGGGVGTRSSVRRSHCLTSRPPPFFTRVEYLLKYSYEWGPGTRCTYRAIVAIPVERSSGYLRVLDRFLLFSPRNPWVFGRF